MSHSLLHDPDRLAAVSATHLLDADSSDDLDQLTELARRLLHAPVALISLVTGDRQFFPSALGLPEPWQSRREMPLSHSFCQHTLGSAQPLIVSDAREHELLRHNKAINELGAVAYAGMPLISESGHSLGAFCAIDVKPREWTAEEIDILTLLRTAVLNRIRFTQQLEETRQHAAALQRALAAVQKTERYHRVLAENAVDLVSIVSATGTIVYKSPSVLPMLGYVPEALIHRDAFELIHPEDREYVEMQFRRLIGEPAGVLHAEFRYRHSDGSYRVLSGKAVNLLTEPAIGGIVFNSTDVTARRRAEEQLRHAQKTEVLSQLAAGMVHDLNNSLSVILANVDLMTVSPEELDKETRSGLLDVRAAASSAAELTQRLLAVGRQAALQPRPTSLESLIPGIVRLAKRALARGITLTAQVPENLPNAWADAGAVEQILLNLIANARDAMPNGGTLRVDAGLAHIDDDFRERHSWATEDAYIVLHVSDSGSGIDEITLSRMFEPFFTTKPEGKGTGLGLPMVMGIATQLGGGVIVNSEIGSGTVVSVYLRPAGNAEIEQVRGTAGQEQRNATILLVDDLDVLRNTGKRLLEQAGYAVVTAAHGGEALAVLEEQPGAFDLVISDLQMPVMDGRELFRAMDDRGIAVRKLLSSGMATGVEHPQEADSLREIPAIAKPWSMADFLATVAHVLGGSGAR